MDTLKLSKCWFQFLIGTVLLCNDTTDFVGVSKMFQFLIGTVLQTVQNGQKRNFEVFQFLIGTVLRN